MITTHLVVFINIGPVVALMQPMIGGHVNRRRVPGQRTIKSRGVCGMSNKRRINAAGAFFVGLLLLGVSGDASAQSWAKMQPQPNQPKVSKVSPWALASASDSKVPSWRRTKGLPIVGSPLDSQVLGP